jgi:predicted AlkP superfamily pyrophosphatase or phosphodiesterase
MFKKIILLFVFSLSFNTITAASAEKEKPYILIVSLDGFRWDYLDRNLTPNLKKIENNGVRALNLQPVFPSKTFPNHYSIVTGLYPQNHGIIHNSFININTGERYRIGDTVSVRNDKWYHGTSIWTLLQKNGIKSASYFWPGSEVHKAHPTYFKKFDKSIPHNQRIESIISWLQLPEADRPHLLLLYFCDTDTKGHHFGPDSEELNNAVTFLDSKIAYLQKRLNDIAMLNKINLIVLSDHGMTDISDSKIIDLSGIIEKYKLEYSGKSPVISLYPKNNKEKTIILSELKDKEEGYKVYSKSNTPVYYHYSQNDMLGDILIVADKGYSLLVKQKASTFRLKNKGNHGYDNHLLDMQGIFLARGPVFKRAYKTGQLRNIDIFPLICRIMNIGQPQKIDGNIECIDFILR